ncbi:MAG: hypothetical protein J0H88_10060 [Sphingomonadales bacterium]|nr:hypothetical protein [Sphingomonadales bacterium]
MDPLVPNLALFAGKGIGIALRDPGRLVLGDCFEDSASTAWGNYLELMADQAEGLTISRAPITGMPLYWLEAAGGVLLFSHLELIEGLDVALSVDEEYLRYLLSFSNFRTARTGLSGAQELLPGTALILGRGIPATETFWSPWPHARGRVGESDAPMLLEQRIRACVTAWANSRDSIVVELSGGLDSSIVAAALAQGGHTFSAATIATASPDGDERRFARAVAKSCGIDLVEYVHGDAVLDLTAGPAFLAPRPATYGVLAGIDAALGSATNEMSGGQHLYRDRWRQCLRDQSVDHAGARRVALARSAPAQPCRSRRLRSPLQCNRLEGRTGRLAAMARRTRCRLASRRWLLRADHAPR